jgi:hypothetical protein
MTSNPFMTLDFANQLAQSRPLTEIGAGLNQVITQRRQEEAAAAAQQQYQDAMARFMKDRTPENRMAVMEAGNAIGRFDQVQQQVQMFDSATRQQEVDEIVGLYGPLSSGNTDQALAAIDREIAAYENAQQKAAETAYPGVSVEEAQRQLEQAEQAAVYGQVPQEAVAAARQQLQQAQSNQPGMPQTPQELQALKQMREAIQNGNGEQVLGMLELELANLGEEGSAVLDNFSAIREERREDQRLAIDVMDAARDIVADEQELARLGQQAEEDPVFGERMLNILNYASAAKNGADMDFDDIMDFRENLEGAWFKRSEPFRQVSFAHGKITELYNEALQTQGGEGGTWVDPDTGQEYEVQAGLRDLMLIQSVQRLIDDAVVRESDIRNIANTESAAGRLNVFMANLLRGDKLSPRNRAEIMNISDDILEASVEYTDRQVFPALGQSWEDFGGEDVLSFRSVFGDWIPISEREEPTPDFGRARTYLSEMYGDTTVEGRTVAQYIAGMTEEEISEAFPQAWELATRQSTNFKNWQRSEPQGLLGRNQQTGRPSGTGGGSVATPATTTGTNGVLPPDNIVTTAPENRRSVDELATIPSLDDVEGVRAALRFMWPHDGVQPETGKTIEEMSLEELREVYDTSWQRLQSAQATDEPEVGDW